MNRSTLTLALPLAFLSLAGSLPAATYLGRDGVVATGADALAIVLDADFADKSLKVTDDVVHLGGGRYSIERTIRNAGTLPVFFKDTLRVRDCFAADRYLIPGNLYNGNEHGSSNTPKGLMCEGEPWTFAYDRTGIPSCSLTENAETGVALFAAADTTNSLVSSVALVPLADGRHEHRIVRPVTEAPYTYAAKGSMLPRKDDYLRLKPGESFTSKSFVLVCRPRWRNFACANLIAAADDLLKPELKPHLSNRQVFDLGIAYAKALLKEYKGKTLVVTHYGQRIYPFQSGGKVPAEEWAKKLNDPYWTDIGAFHDRYEIGWADQNFLNARMLAEAALRSGDADLLRKATGVFDAFVATQRPNGLLFTRYEMNFEAKAAEHYPCDVCNLGWGAAEAVRMHRLLKEHGQACAAYLGFAQRLCDFLLANWSDEFGFGKSYWIDGRPFDRQGTIGVFVIPALVELYAETQETKYLAAAERAYSFYLKRDLENFVCTAGALDCQCVDKETVYPLLYSGLRLFEITKNDVYLTAAEKAAVYFTSWMFFYDAIYPDSSDFLKYGYHTTGGTSVSAEHNAIDAWGAIAVPDLMTLAKLTGCERWRHMGELMWANAMLGLTERKGQLIHGLQRPIGSQNEGFFQSRWTKYRVTCEERGHFNDCLSAWCGAYRMWSALRMGL